MAAESDYGDHLVQSAKEREKASPVWDMSQERWFMETLLNQRFNFFLIFFSLVVAGSVNSKEQIYLRLVLTVGAAIALLLSLPIWRAQVKLDLILDDLKKDPSHPMTIIDSRAGAKLSMRKIIGFGVPPFCVLLLLVGAVCAWANVIQVQGKQVELRCIPSVLSD